MFVRNPLNRELVATFEIIVSVHDNASEVIDKSGSVPNGSFLNSFEFCFVFLLFSKLRVEPRRVRLLHSETDHQRAGRQRQRSSFSALRRLQLHREDFRGSAAGHNAAVGVCGRSRQRPQRSGHLSAAPPAPRRLRQAGGPLHRYESHSTSPRFCRSQAKQMMQMETCVSLRHCPRSHRLGDFL